MVALCGGGGVQRGHIGGWDCRYWDCVLNFFPIGYASPQYTMTPIYYVDLMGGPAGPYRGVVIVGCWIAFCIFSLDGICIYDPNIQYLSGRKNYWMHYVDKISFFAMKFSV